MKEFEHIKKKMLQLSDLQKIRETYKEKKIVYTCGCFDVLHVGHSVFFSQAKSFGDILVIGIGRDSVLRTLKGDKRPIQCELNRALVVAAHQDVDYCVLQEDLDSPQKIAEYKNSKIDFRSMLKELRPDIFIVSGGGPGVDTKQLICQELGIEYVIVQREAPEYVEQKTSSEIIELIEKL